MTVKQQLRCGKPELFNEMVDELAASGMLVKETGRNGGVILLRIPVGDSTNGVFGCVIEKEKEEDAS